MQRTHVCFGHQIVKCVLRFNPSFSLSRSYRALIVADVQIWILPLGWRASFAHTNHSIHLSRLWPLDLPSSEVLQFSVFGDVFMAYWIWQVWVCVCWELRLWLTSACCRVVCDSAVLLLATAPVKASRSDRLLSAKASPSLIDHTENTGCERNAHVLVQNSQIEFAQMIRLHLIW